MRFARPVAVALISAGTVSYEILLLRVFAIEYFHHFAYMAIGVAMLGFGASGTFWALAGAPRHRRTNQWFAWAAVCTAVSLIVSPALVHRIALDATQLAWDLRLWPRLALMYGLLALPFSAGALAILLALTLTRRPGWIYGASFLGAALGAMLALAALSIAFPTRALALPALVASVAAVAAVASGTASWRSVSAACLTVLMAARALHRPPWRVVVTPYKGLPQVEAYPGARRVAERASPVGWVVAVAAPAFRYAPGLSLAFRGSFPSQTALFVDGQITGAVAAWEDTPSAGTLLDWLPSAAPYALGNRERVLIIGAGGGTEVENALAHGAREVTAVELHPALVNLTETLAPPSRSLHANARVEWVVGDARGYAARARERFDLVTLSPTGGMGAAVAGVYSLDEDFLHTAEAYLAYVARLSDRGVLAITRWLTVPPRDNVRVILTAARALDHWRPDGLSRGLAVVRSWATATVMLKPSGFAPEEIATLRAWATERRFDLDWYPGIAAAGPGFNLLDEPTLFHAAAAGVAGRDEAARFAATYPFDVAPVTDARPFPHHFLRLRSLGLLLASSRGTWLPFAEWGVLALLATLCQSVVMGGLLLGAAATRRQSRSHTPPSLALIGYFASIGLGYLAAEIAAVQQLGLLLGHPVYAVAAVLAAFFICSGAGSAWSDRLSAAHASKIAVTLSILLALQAAALLRLVHVLQPADLVARATGAVLALVPLALIMGAPFPIGLRALAGESGRSGGPGGPGGPGGADPGRFAWAWAANGFASVVAAPLAALIALQAGSQALLLVAALAYAAAAVLVRSGSPASSQVA
jgi:hypothetical protein